MDEGHAVPVLRCSRCRKPFDKQATLKRHGYYCRSKRESAITRSRSCICCAKSKARCDKRRPACSRCVAKAIECHYPARTSRGPDSGLRFEPTEVVPPDEVINDNELRVFTPGLTSFEDVYFGWFDPDGDLASFMNPQTTEESVQHTSPISSDVVRHSTPSIDQAIQAREPVPFSSASIPTQPTYRLRSITRRSNLDTRSQRTAILVLHTLKSYPLMILRLNTLPPLIHPCLLSCDVGEKHMESLNNCISLVHMIGSGVPGCRKLFWKFVRMECERWSEEYSQLSEWGLLAAMLALSIYIIIRLDEGPTDDNDFDYLLVAAVKLIAGQLTSCVITRGDDLESNWKAWIFEESIRRLCVVFRIVDMLVYFEPAAMCHLHNTDLIIAPLPAKKQLWEACDRFEWKAECEKEPGVRNDFALTANGDLVKLDQDPLQDAGQDNIQMPPVRAKTPSRSAGKWDEWCSEMDGFGGLIMLAASLAT